MTLAKTESQALSTIPADLTRDAGKGRENIGQDDVRPPRVLICQSGSPQRKPDDQKQIKGLNELDIFNDLSEQIYGRGPLKIIIIKTIAPFPRYMQFAPMDEGGGVIDFDVKPNDPRTAFTSDAEGHRVKPVATKFYDYLVWLPEHQEVAAFSLKSTQLKVAIKLNGLMGSPIKLEGAVVIDPPAWARTYSIASVMERRDAYAWGNYILRQEGVTDAATREQCSTLYDAYSKKNVIVEHEAHEGAEGEPVDDKDIPF